MKDRATGAMRAETPPFSEWPREKILQSRGCAALLAGVVRWGPELVFGCGQGGFVVSLASVPLVLEVACRWRVVTLELTRRSCLTHPTRAWPFVAFPSTRGSSPLRCAGLRALQQSPVRPGIRGAIAALPGKSSSRVLEVAIALKEMCSNGFSGGARRPGSPLCSQSRVEYFTLVPIPSGRTEARVGGPVDGGHRRKVVGRGAQACGRSRRTCCRPVHP